MTQSVINSGPSSITVCICTFKRQQLLSRLLTALLRQETGGLFSYSIVVVDNDRSRSAEAVVAAFAASSPITIEYYVEPRQGIALARNKAIENACGELIAFIDDDEFPIDQWLLILYGALRKYGVDGVLGPVKPHFDVKPPQWVVTAGLYDRPGYPTGSVIDWRKGRTGNVLLKREILASQSQWFRPEFRTGEDQDLFRRLIEAGHVFGWCDEAVAYEVVPPSRWNRVFLLRKALLRGAASRLHATFGWREVATSIIAVPTYTAVLPFAFVLGQGRFMSLAVKLCDHMGRLLALVGINPVREPYVTG